jgi:hypothetical protein
MDEMVITRARENPFASDRVEALVPFEPEWLGETWTGLMERLRGLDYRVAVVGPHGSGKTTLLAGVKTRLERQGFRVGSFFLNEERTRLNESEWRHLERMPAGEPSPIILLDGAEQMPWRDWRRLQTLANRFRGLVTTQHRRGKLPLLVRTGTSVEMLRQFVRRLAPGYDWDEGELERVYLCSKGNIREALWHCYDRVA